MRINLSHFKLFFAILFFGIISCGDLQKESSDASCNSALDNQDFETSEKVCSSSSGLGDTYMGKAGFTMKNLMDNSGTEEKEKSHITSATGMGGDVDDTAAKILHIINASYTKIKDDTQRKEKIDASLDYFNKAAKQYNAVMVNGKDKFERKNGGLMYTFASVFAMQIAQIKYYDSSDNSCSNPASCTEVTNNADKIYDGYIFPNDKNWKQAQLGNDVGATCEGLGPQMSYIDNITKGMTAAELTSSTGSSTAIITSSKNAVCCIISGLYDACMGNTTCQKKCDRCDNVTCS